MKIDERFDLSARRLAWATLAALLAHGCGHGSDAPGILPGTAGLSKASGKTPFGASGCTAHQLALTFNAGGRPGKAMLASRSLDRGRTWSNPVALQLDTDPDFIVDKGAITADPSDPKLVYAVWDRLTDQTLDNSPLAH